MENSRSLAEQWAKILRMRRRKVRQARRAYQRERLELAEERNEARRVDELPVDQMFVWHERNGKRVPAGKGGRSGTATGRTICVVWHGSFRCVGIAVGAQGVSLGLRTHIARERALTELEGLLGLLGRLPTRYRFSFSTAELEESIDSYPRARKGTRAQALRMPLWLLFSREELAACDSDGHDSYLERRWRGLPLPGRVAPACEAAPEPWPRVPREDRMADERGPLGEPLEGGGDPPSVAGQAMALLTEEFAASCDGTFRIKAPLPARVREHLTQAQREAPGALEHIEVSVTVDPPGPERDEEGS